VRFLDAPNYSAHESSSVFITAAFLSHYSSATLSYKAACHPSVLRLTAAISQCNCRQTRKAPRRGAHLSSPHLPHKCQDITYK